MDSHIVMEDTFTTVMPVRVKFKGSKLAMGSSKMPSASVDGDFMLKLTALNKSMLVGAAVVVATKKKKKIEDVGELSLDGRVPAQKRKIGSGVSVTSGGNADAQQGQDGNPGGEVESTRDRTMGILRPSEALAPSTQLSVFYPLHHNRKQLQKLADATEPADMHITCDYDFWVWIDAQNLFSPLSYKSHDLSVLALKDIGDEAVRSRWYQPSQTAAPEPSSSASASASASVSSSCGATSSGLPGTSHSSSAGGSGAEVALELSSASKILSTERERWSGAAAGGVSLATWSPQEQVRPVPLYVTNGAVCGGSMPTGAVDLHFNGYNNGDVLWSESDQQCASSSSSRGGTAPPRHSATLQGVDDGTCEVYCGDSDAPADDASSDADRACDAFSSTADPSAADMPINDRIAQLSEDLLREHLQVNELLARLRKQALQGPAARGELEEAGKAAEREKAALAKWRKTKTQQAGIHSSSKNGSGTTGIAMKAKSSHKKKLGSY